MRSLSASPPLTRSSDSRPPTSRAKALRVVVLALAVPSCRCEVEPIGPGALCTAAGCDQVEAPCRAPPCAAPTDGGPVEEDCIDAECADAGPAVCPPSACSGNGTCTVVDGEATCGCEDPFVAGPGLTCVDPCAGGACDVVDGACGTADRTVADQAPTDGLCSAGDASVLTGGGPYSWTCAGANGGADAECATLLMSDALEVSTDHAELRSVRLGHPGCGGIQVYASASPTITLTNQSAGVLRVTMRLRDPQGRFMWTDCRTQAEQSEVVLPLAAGASTNWIGVQWNSGADSGIDHSDATAIDFLVHEELVQRVIIHGKERPAVSCPATVVRWSATNAWGPTGECGALAPAMLETLADPGSGEVFADPAYSESGYSGRQGISCAAVEYTLDAEGVSIPSAGGSVYTYPARSGAEACTQ